MDGDFEQTVPRNAHRVVASFFDEEPSASEPEAPATVTVEAPAPAKSDATAPVKSLLALRQSQTSIDDELDSLFGPTAIELGILPQPRVNPPLAKPCLTAFLLRLHRSTALNLLELGLQTLADLQAMDKTQLSRTQLTPGQLQEVLAALAKESPA